MLPILRSPANRRRLAIVIPIVLVILMLAAGASSARDIFLAGQRGTEPVRITVGQQATAMATATRIGHALGLPTGSRRTVTRLADRFEGGTVDEVTTFDAGGRPLAILRLDVGGAVRTAVALGWHTATGRLTPDQARTAAGRLAAAAGLPPSGTAEARLDPAGAGWTVLWPRHVAGAPVRGDGLWVRLWADGTFHSVANQTSELAPEPPTRIAPAVAIDIIRDHLAGWDLEGASLAAPVLAWVAPNDLLDPALADAPSAVRRLAWVVRVSPSPASGSTLRAVEIDVDAGDGSLLGGDVLE